jgi:hypothetical protein
MSWATIWSKARDAAIKNQVKQIHSQECTVRMPLQNVDTFIRRSFKANDGMYCPEKS